MCHDTKETWPDQTNPTPQFPKQLGLMCHGDGFRKLSSHGKDHKRWRASQKLMDVSIALKIEYIKLNYKIYIKQNYKTCMYKT